MWLPLCPETEMLPEASRSPAAVDVKPWREPVAAEPLTGEATPPAKAAPWMMRFPPATDTALVRLIPMARTGRLALVPPERPERITSPATVDVIADPTLMP